jgi:hypothetical protein
MKFQHWWGVQVGRWHLTWWDAWDRRPCFEVSADDWTAHYQRALTAELDRVTRP